MPVSSPVSSKVTAATLAAAVGAILVYAIEQALHLDLPTAIEGAVVVLLTLAAGYLVPEEHPAPSAIETVHERGLK